MSIAQRTLNPANWQVYVRYGLSAIFAALLPIALWYSSSYWLQFSYTRNNALFEYFGFSASVVLITNLIIDIKRAQKSFKDLQVPLLLFGLTAFATLVWFSEYSAISYDFSAYQAAAKALLKGLSPYGHEPVYIYPPFLVYFIAFLYKTVQWISVNVFATRMTSKEYFYLVFYLYQVLQYGLTLISMGLVYLFARSLNHTQYSAALLTTLLFLANLPLLCNFRLNQVNLWVLIVLLLAILLVDRNPVLAGVFVALGTHIKVYPLIALLPWLVSRKWLAVAGALVSGVLIFLVQLFVPQGWEHWVAFTGYLQNVEKGVALRNNSLHSLAWNLSHLLFPGSSAQVQATIATLLVIGFTVLAIAWTVKRYLQRMQAPSLTDHERFLGKFYGHDHIDVLDLPFGVGPSSCCRPPPGSLGGDRRHRSVGRSGWFKPGVSILGANV